MRDDADTSGLWKEGQMGTGVLGRTLGAVVNLDHPARYVHWGWFQISVANLVVIVLMLAVFAVAILAPFPGHGRRSEPT